MLSVAEGSVGGANSTSSGLLRVGGSWRKPGELECSSKETEPTNLRAKESPRRPQQCNPNRTKLSARTS